MSEKNNVNEESMTIDKCLEELKEFMKTAKELPTDLGDKLVEAEKALTHLETLITKVNKLIGFDPRPRCADQISRAVGGR